MIGIIKIGIIKKFVKLISVLLLYIIYYNMMSNIIILSYEIRYSGFRNMNKFIENYRVILKTLFTITLNYFLFLLFYYFFVTRGRNEATADRRETKKHTGHNYSHN